MPHITLGGALYLVAVAVFLVVVWIRIGEWDRNHEELEQRRRR